MITQIIHRVLYSSPEMGNNPSSKHSSSKNLPHFPPPPPLRTHFGTVPVRRNHAFVSELEEAVRACGEQVDSAQPQDTLAPKREDYSLIAQVKYKSLKIRKKVNESVFYDDGFYNAAVKPLDISDNKPQPDEGQRRLDDRLFDLDPDQDISPDNLMDVHEDVSNAHNLELDTEMHGQVDMEDPPLRNSQILVPEPVEKRYDPLDMTLKFVTRQDDIDPLSSEDGASSLRAEMSCGHAVTPESLTNWCCFLLEQGKYKFRCPAIIEGTKQCNKVWSYQEVRKMAVLTVEEMEYFESTVARLAASQYCDIMPCPKCRTNVERRNLSNLCVCCPICKADQDKVYQFCWQCLREWKGPGPQPDRCRNEGCFNKDLQLLQACKTISLPEVKGVTACPSVRACPMCGILVEHSQDYCKNIDCPRCHVEFCFVCLKLKRECNKTSLPYDICKRGMAPRQTSIPVWKRK